MTSDTPGSSADAIYSAIGKFFVSYSHFHSTLEVLLIHLSGVEDHRRAWALISGNTTQPIADSFFSIIHEVSEFDWTEQDKRLVTRARKEINQLIEDRNRTAHDIWTLGGPGQPLNPELGAVRIRYGRSPIRGATITSQPFRLTNLHALSETTDRLRSVARSIALVGLIGATRRPTELLKVVNDVLASAVD